MCALFAVGFYFIRAPTRAVVCSQALLEAEAARQKAEEEEAARAAAAAAEEVQFIATGPGVQGPRCIRVITVIRVLRVMSVYHAARGRVRLELNLLRPTCNGCCCVPFCF